MIIRRIFLFNRRHRLQSASSRPSTMTKLDILVMMMILGGWLTVNTAVEAAASNQQPSTYRLIGSPTTYAQYSPWYACLNGSLAFEFKTHEPNGMLLYAQSLPYKYVQISLVDGRVRVRMRLGERDDPRGEFLVQKPTTSNLNSNNNKQPTTLASASIPRLNDEKWHEVKLVRLNERTVLEVDGESYFHVHTHASLDGNDLLFGEIDPIASNYLYNGLVKRHY